VAGSLRVVFVGYGRTEKGHQTIAQELVDCPFVPVDFVHNEAQTPVHDLVNRLGIEVPKHSGGIGHIREHNGDDFAFTLDGTARGENLVGKVLGRVGTGLVKVQRFGFFGYAKVVAALGAELSVGGIGIPALWAGHL
jgi:hypothetical protein